MISHNVSGELFQQFSNKPCSDVVTGSVHQCDRSGVSCEASVFFFIGWTDLQFHFTAFYGLSGGWEGPFFSGIPIVHFQLVPWRLEEVMQKVMGKQKRGDCRSNYQCHRQRRLLRLVALKLYRRSNNKWHRPHQLPSLLAVKAFPCRALQFSAPLILAPCRAIGLFPQSLKMLQLQGQLNRSQYSQMTISLMNQIGCHPFMSKFLQIGRHCRTHHLLRDPRTFTQMDPQQTKGHYLVHFRTTLPLCREQYRTIRHQAH